MNKLKLIFFLLLLILSKFLLAENLYWSHIDGDYGNNIYAISRDSANRVFIGSEKGYIKFFNLKLVTCQKKFNREFYSRAFLK